MSNADSLEDAFRNPPDSARPGVYWYFMDGNLDRDEMVRDLESMKEVGLGNLVFLEVDVGVPRGPVKFMSEEWQDCFANAVHHAERLGIDITLGAGPGWTGSGGPWVKPEQSMQHLVFSEVDANGPGKFDAVLPAPGQRSTRWHTMRTPFFEDVVVYAFPKCDPVIEDIDEVRFGFGHVLGLPREHVRRQLCMAESRHADNESWKGAGRCLASLRVRVGMSRIGWGRSSFALARR